MSDDARLQYIIDGLLSVGEPTFDEAGHALEQMRAEMAALRQAVSDGADRLAEIKARAEAATPGPWLRATNEVWGDSGYIASGQPTWAHGIHVAYVRSDTPNREAVAEFIAHSRDDIAWLIAQIDKQALRSLGPAEHVCVDVSFSMHLYETEIERPRGEL